MALPTLGPISDPRQVSITAACIRVALAELMDGLAHVQTSHDAWTFFDQLLALEQAVAGLTDEAAKKADRLDRQEFAALRQS